MYIKSICKILFFIVISCFSILVYADDEDDNREKFGFNENLKIVFKSDPDYLNSFYRNRSFLDFADSLHGLFLSSSSADNMTITATYYTNNGGLKWNQSGFIIDTTFVFLEGFEFNGKDEVYVQFGATTNGWLGNKCKFLKTNYYSLGTSWNNFDTMPHSGTGRYYYDHLMVINRDTIFIITSSNEIMKTTFGGGYGGKYWNKYVPNLVPKPWMYYSLEKAKLDNSYFLVYTSLGSDSMKPGYYIARSSDYGATWESYFCKRLSNDDTYNFEFVDYDTWYISNNDHFKPDPHITLVKTTDQCQTYDTVFCHRKYSDLGSNIKIYGKNADKFVLTNSNRCLAISTDGGDNFQYVINPDDVNKTDMINVGFCEPDRFFFHSIKTGYLMMYSPSVSVNAEIGKFSSNIYPNPANQDSPLYIELQNESARSVNCKIYNSSGELIKQSKDMFAPKGWHIIDFTTDGMVSGSYFLIIESNGEILAREKFIVK